MKYIKKFNEDINVPIKVGDTILGGRFKNKRILVKKIGKNKKGDITINDKPLLKFRLLKESISQEDIDNGLAYLKDDGFKIIMDNTSNNINGIIQIFKQKEFKDHNTMDNLMELNWSDIENDILPFIEVNKDFIKDVILTYSTFTTYNGTSEIKTYDRDAFSVDEILEDKDFGKILKVNIRLK